MTTAVVEAAWSTAHRRLMGPWLVVIAAWAVLYAPSYVEAWRTIWNTEEHGHGPIVAAIAAWLFWRGRDAFKASTPVTGVAALPGLALLALAACAYAFGRALSTASVVFLSQWLLVGGVLWMMGGRGLLGRVWFAWMFLLFMVPLPASISEWMSSGLKPAISTMVVETLHAWGYPVAQSGVVISMGAYQLLVADACSGLNSLVSVAALGALYIHITSHARSSAQRWMLALALMPITVLANYLRVLALALITYHLGDAAGQGFLHEGAGLVSTMVALLAFMGVDWLWRRAVTHSRAMGDAVMPHRSR